MFWRFFLGFWVGAVTFWGLFFGLSLGVGSLLSDPREEGLLIGFAVVQGLAAFGSVPVALAAAFVLNMVWRRGGRAITARVMIALGAFVLGGPLLIAMMGDVGSAPLRFAGILLVGFGMGGLCAAIGWFAAFGMRRQIEPANDP